MTMMEEQESGPETAVTPSPATTRAKTLEREGRGELIKFAILVLVCIGVVGVVALSRPLIFDHILPRIVQSPSLMAPETGVGGVVEDPHPVESLVPTVEASAEGEGDMFLPSVVTGNDGDGGETAVGDPGEEGPAPTPQPLTHSVQRGETLTLIAEQYNVPVQVLMEANGLINPNYIQIGQTLIIPGD
jgi:LysM repeat protein